MIHKSHGLHASGAISGPIDHSRWPKTGRRFSPPRLNSTTHFKDLDTTMARRVAKKKAYWDKGDSLLTWTLIDEAVLMRPAGGKEVMRKQLEHLLVMAELPHVSLRVIPFSSGEHMGVGGSVQIIGLEDRDVAYSGALNGGRLIESPGEVREYSITFDRIGVKAASEEASREIIKQYLEMYR